MTPRDAFALTIPQAVYFLRERSRRAVSADEARRIFDDCPERHRAAARKLIADRLRALHNRST